MENANSKDYLEKIKIQVIENLRQTAHAPSVQMTDVPRTTMLGGTDNDEDDAELDDLDEDENKDVRTTKRRWDQRVARDDEFDDSDDEEENEANGRVFQQNGQSKRRNIMDYQNDNPASDIEMNSGVATPDVRNDVDDLTTALIKEANAEVNAEVMEKKVANGLTVEAQEVGPSNAPSRADTPKPAIDTEGDIDMDVPQQEEAPRAPSPAPTATSSVPVPPVEAAASDIKQEGGTEQEAPKDAMNEDTPQ